MAGSNLYFVHADALPEAFAVKLLKREDLEGQVTEAFLNEYAAGRWMITPPADGKYAPAESRELLKEYIAQNTIATVDEIGWVLSQYLTLIRENEFSALDEPWWLGSVDKIILGDNVGYVFKDNDPFKDDSIVKKLRPDIIKD